MYKNPTEAIDKVRFSSFFAETYNKTATAGATFKFYMWAGTILLEKNVVPDEKYVPTNLTQLHGILDCNDTEKRTTFQEAPTNRELELTPKTSQEIDCS
jgi:hypothetical protein